MKTIFKVGDRVYDAHYGWGTITVIYQKILYPITVEFTFESIMYLNDGRRQATEKVSLSFVEYDFVNGGFSQKRPEMLPEKGDVVWVRDCESEEWTIAYFIEKQDNCYLINLFNPHNEGHEICYKYLTIVNPYKK
jgi:hypothetical protein